MSTHTITTASPQHLFDVMSLSVFSGHIFESGLTIGTYVNSDGTHTGLVYDDIGIFVGVRRYDASNTVVLENITAVPANIDYDTFFGGADNAARFNAIMGGADIVLGSSGDDILRGGGGADSLNGGAGADAMAGGAGDDTYYVNTTTDTITENSGEGTDTVLSDVNLTLGNNVENLTLRGTPGIISGYISDLDGTGNDLANVIIGNLGINTLKGLGGDDTINTSFGGGGFENPAGDTAYGDAGNDSLRSEGGNQAFLYGGSGNDTITATRDYESGVTLYGDGANSDASAVVAGDDTLDLSGADFMLGFGSATADGGGGNDLIKVGNNVMANLSSQTLQGGDGVDTLDLGALNPMFGTITTTVNLATQTAAVTWSNPTGAITMSGFENVAGTNFNDTITGSDVANVLNGRGGNDVIDGGAGADAMAGGADNDTYIVDDAGDTVTENSAEGIDTVKSSVDFTLGDNVEYLILTGSAVSGTGNGLNNAIRGNELANTLSGGEGNDVLNGLAGADSMTGGAGDDKYYVDNVEDSVVEAAGGGFEVVYATVSGYTLGDNVERLTLIGTGDLNGTGNSGNNTLFGNSGMNVLDGGQGADTMRGGAGDDTYIVDNSGDAAIELANNGLDTVMSGISHTLRANIENLTLDGTDNINGNGNDLGNVITGNSGNNRLVGGAGLDTMAGGGGNDIYYVDAGGDTVNELAGGGTDTVYTSANFTLGDNVENLVILGTDHIYVTGNSADNAIFGNSGNNFLDGADGKDTLSGGAGADLLYGGAGADFLRGGTSTDSFYFAALSDSAKATGVDTIADFLTGDSIDLRSIDANSDLAGQQIFAFDMDGLINVGDVMVKQLAVGLMQVNVYTNADSIADMTINVRTTGLAAGDFLFLLD